MALEAVRLKNDSNCESVRVNVVVCPNDERKSEAAFENQSNWESVGCIVEHETKRKAIFENRSKWEPVDIMDRAIEEAKRETKFENWEPVGDIMERAIQEAKIQTMFENQRNWEPVDEVECANDTSENPNWEPVEVKCANKDENKDEIFENDRNWEPGRDVGHDNLESREAKFESDSNWEPVDDHANHETNKSKFESNPNWEPVDDEMERSNDEASKETMFENEPNWEPVDVDIVEHNNNQSKQETMFQVLPKQCIKENPNWEETKSIGDIFLNHHQIKGDFVLSSELLQSSNLYFTIQGQPHQSTLNEYQTEIGERRFIEINKGTPGKVVQIPISILQDPGFNGQMPFEIPVPPLIPLTNKRNSSTSKQSLSKPNESQTQAERIGKLPESILPDLNADNSIELPPLVPIRKKYKSNVETDKIQSCADKCCDKIHTETSIFKKPTVLQKDGDSKSECNVQTAQKKQKNRPKKFPCSKCDFIADHSYQLKIHISLTHDANNQFKCNYCDYKSKYKKALYQHQKTHTEFRCNLCDYTCRQKSNLKIHQRTHKVTKETLVPEAPRTIHGAFRFCSGNSTGVRSQSHAVSRAPHTYTSNQ